MRYEERREPDVWMRAGARPSKSEFIAIEPRPHEPDAFELDLGDASDCTGLARCAGEDCCTCSCEG